VWKIFKRLSTYRLVINPVVNYWLYMRRFLVNFFHLHFVNALVLISLINPSLFLRPQNIID